MSVGSDSDFWDTVLALPAFVLYVEDVWKNWQSGWLLCSDTTFQDAVEERRDAHCAVISRLELPVSETQVESLADHSPCLLFVTLTG